MDAPSLLLVAHGTRNPRGVAMIAELADAVAARAGTTRVAFVDVLGPSPSEVLRELDGPVVAVPAFLASGYHVRVDVPREVSESGHRDVAVTPALGPDPVLARVMLDRLRAAGHRRGDAIVLAAAGSSDRRALMEHRRAAALLADAVGNPVRIGYVGLRDTDAADSSRAPASVSDAVAALRTAGHPRVAVASYLLARGLFHTRLADAGADVVAEPLGVHTSIVDLVISRYLTGARTLTGAAESAPRGLLR